VSRLDNALGGVGQQVEAPVELVVRCRLGLRIDLFKAMIRISAPQSGKWSGGTSWMRASSKGPGRILGAARHSAYTKCFV